MTTPVYHSLEDKRMPCASSAVHQDWPMELYTLSAASLLLAGLATMLLYFNGRPAPSMQSDVNITALVSISAVCIVSLLCYTVVKSMRPPSRIQLDETATTARTTTPFTRSRGLETIIAGFLVLAVVTLGPAIRFIVHYPSQIVTTGTARLPLSTAFAAYADKPGSQNPWENYLSIEAINAVYNGFFGSPVPFDVECPSGNCTWDKPYTTLGLCSSCTNLTSQLTSYTDEFGEEVGTQLPNGFFLRYNDEFRLPMGERQFYTSMNSTSRLARIEKFWKYYDYESVAYRGVPGKFHTLITIIGSTREIAVHMSEAPAPAAYECILQWCLQQSTAKFFNGELEETLVNIINDTTVNDEDSMSILSRQLTDPATKYLYNVSRVSEIVLSNAMAKMVNGSRNANTTGDADPLTSLWNAIARPENSPADLYAHIAQSLSTFMRVNNTAIKLANYSTAEGVATKQIEVVQVSWGFLAYPLLVIALCSLFAVRMTRQS